jgi:hypothetical protein
MLEAQELDEVQAHATAGKATPARMPGRAARRNSPILDPHRPSGVSSIGCTTGESRLADAPAGLEPRARVSCPGTLWWQRHGTGVRGPAQPTSPQCSRGQSPRRPHHWPSRRWLKRQDGPLTAGTWPARAAGPRTGTGAERPAYLNAERTTRKIGPGAARRSEQYGPQD